MVYDDVVKPAKTGVANAKHGGGVILTPGVISNQSIDAGVSVPVSKDEPRLTNRFDDQEYYGNSLSGNLTFISNTTWKAPHGLTTQVNIKAYGQGGYGQTANAGNAGIGGGGGAYAETNLTVVGGRVYSISLNTGVVSGDGGDSSFSFLGTNYCLAKGGRSGTNGGTGGSSGTSIGNVTVSAGGDGGEPAVFGGGNGGNAANGGGLGGLGGPPLGETQGPGQPGEAPGGGGGGGSYDFFGAINYNGAAGGLGKIIISW